ncbi:vWA domain-containing protein [Chenggangzhangella methanolivorans]|uniref:vWA domain-containing protein n=1 Tax=Chenggangzhangella methanolivorans TaxID=1437009 RepID=UPI003D177057
MTDRDLDQRLSGLRRDVPPASEAARADALSAAGAAFEEAQAKKRADALKGSAHDRRHSLASPSGLWRIVMQNRLAIGGVAACLIVAPIGGALFVEQARRQAPDLRQDAAAPRPVQEASPEPEVAAKLESAPKPVAPSGARLERRAVAPPPPPSAPMAGLADAYRGPDVVVGAPENRDRFESTAANGLKVTAQEPVSTFSIDADTASYAWVRRSLRQGRAPSPDQVRIEELINYFPYADPAPVDAATPFRPTVSTFPTPWNADTKLVRIGIKGFDKVAVARPKANLVFLVDVSGSMNAPDKLPLLKASLKLLLTKLGPDDHVAIVTYAGAAGVALEPTRASDKAAIAAAIDRMEAGGSTAGAAGIAEAYRLARKNFDKDGVNRVMLATDGDFNVGESDPDALTRMIEDERKSGVFLSVLGFGQGDYNDALMQRLAQNGNGTAAYIDELEEAQKTLVEEAGAALFPIAKDVKIQVEFNPAQVAEYRLIGYETRMLKREDFKDDRVDAGEIGSGASVTALYEITPPQSRARMTDELRYARPAAEPAPAAGDAEFGAVKIRYKLPDADTSREIVEPIRTAESAPTLAGASDDARFSAAGRGLRPEAAPRAAG